MQTQNSRPSSRPSAGNTIAATLAILQREIDGLRAQLEQAKPPVKIKPETQEQEQLLALLRDGKGVWLTEAQEKTGLSKNVTYTRARQLAYQERLLLSLEPNPAVGKLAFRLRPRQAVLVEE